MALPLSQEDVANLLAEPSPQMRADVATKLAQTIDSPLLTPTELQIAHDIIRVMARDVAVTVRSALSVSLRRATHLPRDVALRLADDVETVALPILADSPILTDADLIDLVRRGSARKQETIAGRPDLTEPVTEVVIHDAGESAVTTLLDNQSARISERGFGKALDRFGQSDVVKSSMVHRAQLPVTVCERLVVMVSDRLQEYLVSHHDVPVTLATDIVMRGRERATLNLSSGSSETELQELVEQMHRHDRLTPFLVLRALCLGDMAFFEIAMATMADVPIGNVRILIHDAGPMGLASLYEKSNMPARLLPAVRVAVGVLRGVEFDGGARDHERYRARVITRILTHFDDFPAEDLDYLLDKLGDVLTVAA